MTDVCARQATPVLLTPVMRRRFTRDGVFHDAHGSYPEIVRQVAQESAAPLIDMHRATERLLRRYGADTSRALFLHLRAGEHPNYPDGIEGNTHFSPRARRRLLVW